MPKQTVVLAILDGWGIGRADASNPIHVVQPENINFIKRNYPAGSLQASGIAVGLPWNEEGSSEVGHLTLGAGKVVYQHLPRISLIIKSGEFFKNPVLLKAFDKAKQNNARVHFVGLLTSGGAHASLDHLQALLKLADQEKFSDINFHLFTDGKDSSPQGAIELAGRIPQEKIASISGRYFAMDRDLHWDRTARVYETLTDQGPGTKDEKQGIPEFLKSFYERGLTDEFVEPTLIRRGGAIKDNDSVIFFNFREDSIRQLTEMFIDPLIGSDHSIPSNLYIATFTQYSNKFNLPAAFPAEEIVNPLGKMLADNDRVQLRVAETEKYAHVTYFFNGFREAPFKNEYRVLIPSRNIAHQDEFPEMMTEAITVRVVSALNEGIYDFILVNYAAPDVIAHTGNFNAGVSAVRAVDRAIGALMKATLAQSHILLITSDHGNIERMIDPRTGERETKHDLSQVPFYLVGNGRESRKSDAAVKKIESGNAGVLSDVAPAILNLLGLSIPQEMTGVDLTRLLQ
ncbi:MAG: 2,3-bisphosphoglycerate-independent phosphoglycerate mutase [Candidatus Colwellbacteria bacterium]